MHGPSRRPGRVPSRRPSQAPGRHGTRQGLPQPLHEVIRGNVGLGVGRRRLASISLRRLGIPGILVRVLGVLVRVGDGGVLGRLVLLHRLGLAMRRQNQRLGLGRDRRAAAGGGAEQNALKRRHMVGRLLGGFG